VGFIEKLLGGWLTKQLDRLVSFVWSYAKIWWKGKEHLSEVNKYVAEINRLTAIAKEEVKLNGKVSDETEKALSTILERRNRGLPFVDDKLQDSSRT